MEIKTLEELRRWSWWQIGGAADYFCLPKTLDEVGEALAWAQKQNCPATVLSGGTNVLISDAGVEGLVICLRELSGIEVETTADRYILRCLAGTTKSEVTKRFFKQQLAPALFLCGIPGDIGGGVVMNAGVGESIRPREFVEITDWVEVMRGPGNLHRLNKSDLSWNYRNTIGWQPGVVVRVQLSWPLEPDPDIPTKVTAATKQRLQKQPLDLPSCGSVFKNPPSGKAGALIESAGLKGYTVGGAQISAKHANFIVNIKRATARDVDTLIKHVQKTVLAKHGVTLEPEVKYLGRW